MVELVGCGIFFISALPLGKEEDRDCMPRPSVVVGLLISLHYFSLKRADFAEPSLAVIVTL